MERRANIRLTKSLDCAITIDRKEYTAKILDISKEGIAFMIEQNANVCVGDEIVISMQDEYLENGQQKTFLGDIIGYIRNITEYDDNMIRCGCFITDEKYSEYVQEQLIMQMCGAKR